MEKAGTNFRILNKTYPETLILGSISSKIYSKKYKLKFGFVTMQPFGTKYSLRRDGGKICSDCQKSVITNYHEFQHLIEEIQIFYEGLDMKVYEQFPFELARPEDMNVSAK